MSSSCIVRREMWVEDLVNAVPDSVGFLIDRGMKPLACGEPVWETLESLARSRSMNDDEIGTLVDELNALREKDARVGTGAA